MLNTRSVAIASALIAIAPIASVLNVLAASVMVVHDGQWWPRHRVVSWVNLDRRVNHQLRPRSEAKEWSAG